MGASPSKPDTEEKVFYNETPIQFSQDVVNHLSDNLAAPETTPERQSTLDAHVRSRIQAELGRLREEEEHVRQEIERALEKENLDRERSMVGEETVAGESGIGQLKTSTVLLGDLEDVRQKVERFQTKRDLNAFPSVKATSEAVAACYLAHSKTPLDCWREVAEFKASVAQVEQHYIDSLR
ncbi:hypothetical protein JAAARDRAFT_205450 [Jaapia argillacea MUCL 33604]|uniref:DUF1690 domain-containing protein n=1 Tax=Jaapia argillacea MUCL 33604 TaxID=933084 RepID=A0A067Q9Y2_9AGAM|nr:hypothetical protein JAAARDRAFT_205450 [Jaapia argillacea MUCL 33604]